jgi:hypothetical protein
LPATTWNAPRQDAGLLSLRSNDAGQMARRSHDFRLGTESASRGAANFATFRQRSINMPTLMDLRSRFAKQRESHASVAGAEESLVADVRGRMTPAQVVEQKLRSLLPKPKASGAGPPRPALGNP